MPRLTDALPKYRKHRASGQAVVTIAGRDIYLGPHGTKTSRREYDRHVSEWLVAGRPSSVAASQNELTLAEVMAAYLRHARERYVKNGEPTSEQDGLRSALRPVKALYATRPAMEFGPLALKAVRQKFIEAGLARTTINQHVSRIKLMFKWAASEELIPAHLHQSLATVAGLSKGKSAARETAPVLPAPDTDVEATLPHLSATVADMVRLQRLTGMRPGEVCSLRPCDIDRSADVWRYSPESHKTEHHDRPRTIYFGPKAQAILRPYLIRLEDAPCFAPRDSEARRLRELHARRVTPLSQGNCPGSRGVRRRSLDGPYAVSSYRQAIRRACGRANVEVWKPNQLRHAAATEVRRKFGLEAAQVLLGHAAADITQVYAERDATLGERIAREAG